MLFEDPTVRVVRRSDGTECGDAPWMAVEAPLRPPRTGATVLQRGQDSLNAVVYALGRAVAERVAEPVETRKPKPEGATP